MFDRFDDKAITCVTKAQYEARLLGHACVKCEHLFLGLFQVDCASTRALGTLSLSLKELRLAVESELSESVNAERNLSGTSEPPFSKELQKVLECNLQARFPKVSTITPEHLFASLLTNSPQRTVKFLRRQGVVVEDFIERLINGTFENSLNTWIRVPKRPLSDEEQKRLEEQFREQFLIEIKNICMFSKSREDAFFMIANIVGKVLRASRALVCYRQSELLRCFEFCEKQFATCESLNWPTSSSILLALSIVSPSPYVLHRSVVEEHSEGALEQQELISSEVISYLGISFGGSGVGNSCLVLHQCDKARNWSEEDLDYIQRLAKAIWFP